MKFDQIIFTDKSLMSHCYIASCIILPGSKW